MNLINVVKITPLLLSNIVLLNTNEQYKLFSYTANITSKNEKIYFKISTQDTWPSDLNYIEYYTNDNTEKKQITELNYNEELWVNITNTERLYFNFSFTKNININDVKITKNNENVILSKYVDNNICNFGMTKDQLTPNTTYNFKILVSNYTPPDPEPEPPEEDQYKDYTSYTIPQSNLQTLRLENSEFLSKSGTDRFNTLRIWSGDFSIYMRKNNQYAKILYSNNEIYLPILGTYIINNVQYNIVDFYFTNNSTPVNLLNHITDDYHYFASETRTTQQSNYIYQNNSFNRWSDKYITYKLKYTSTENNQIEITTNDVGMGNNGNATITNKETDITTMQMYSLFGINPKTTSYFGGQNPTRINQFKSGGSISAPIYQIVEMTNYNEYLQMFSYRNNISQQLGELYVPLINMSKYEDLKLNLIGFRQDSNYDPELAINDITTLFGVLDNLENLGFFPFTFGTIIFIGVVIGFIMIIVKVLK